MEPVMLAIQARLLHRHITSDFAIAAGDACPRRSSFGGRSELEVPLLLGWALAAWMSLRTSAVAGVA